MITLPANLQAFMQGQDLAGLKPFAVLFRNKWNSITNKYELDTSNPIDISDLIVKPNTLSMTLDVSEIAQYNANNVTLTLADTKNYFMEGTPNSYFPDGYQLYGSRVVLYYGLDGTNRTPLFTGVIKDLPTHKPEKYQVDVKLVSPLEMLKDIEAKEFSDKVTGETLTYKGTDTDEHRIYWTTGTGVGGFNAVYANGTKLFEGVDYEVNQTSALGLPAIVTVINSVYYGQTITADYYTWKTGLTVEQIVAGLVGLAGYDSGMEDIRNVVWNTAVRGQIAANPETSIGYSISSGTLLSNYGGPAFYNGTGTGASGRYNLFPQNFRINISFSRQNDNTPFPRYMLGSISNGELVTGVELFIGNAYNTTGIGGYIKLNGSRVVNMQFSSTYRNVTIQYLNGRLTVSGDAGSGYYDLVLPLNGNINEYLTDKTFKISSYSLTRLNSVGADIYTLGINPGVVFSSATLPVNGTSWINLSFVSSNEQTRYVISYRDETQTIPVWNATSMGADIGLASSSIRFKIDITTPTQQSNLSAHELNYLSSTLLLQLVNLSDKNVLEALQDFALISGYEFGVDRNGVFFFRPRVASTSPTYTLDHSELVKVDTVKKNFSDFFTKLTLTFAQVPLEFYANTGTRPTAVDKYGVINKEIDKPDIVNYDNPELAQAIGPQLLEVYSSFPNIIQCVSKLNLALELGDIVSLQRNMNLITPESFTDYTKYKELNTYYRACKITGMNYNFSKRQITYTLRDVSNANTEPEYEFNEYIYDNPVQYGVKE